MKSIRPRLQGKRKAAFENLNKKEKKILVIGDLHAPFIQEGYLEFCQHIYNIYNCNHTIFIGEVLEASKLSEEHSLLYNFSDYW